MHILAERLTQSELEPRLSINIIKCRIGRDADSAFVVEIKAGCCILIIKINFKQCHNMRRFYL